MTPEPPLAAEEEKAMEHNQPSFASAEEYKKEFKYNLIDMLPSTYESSSNAPEHAKDRKRKTNNGTSNGKKKRQEQPNKVILDGPISKFIQKYHSLVKRYLVLNQNALFVYKDNLAFQSVP